MPTTAVPVLGRQLAGRVGLVVRMAWLASTLSLVALVAVGFVRAFRNPALIELPLLAELFARLGLNFRLMMGLALLLPFVVVCMICAVVFARRSRDPMALLFTLGLLAMYSVASRSLLTYADQPILARALPVAFAVALLCLALILGVFPDGRFVPGWARWLAPALLALLIVTPDAGGLLMALVDGEGELVGRARLFVYGWAGVSLAGLLAQIYRYRHASGSVERQQTKWVIAPVGFVLLAFFVVLGAPEALSSGAYAWAGWLMLLVLVPLGTVLPLAVANAVLRHRLYEIDRIISRTVAYLLLSGVLGGTYLTAVLVGTRLLAPLGAGSELAVAAATLAAAAVFTPARRRIQHAVDRRFNRPRYDAEQVVAGFRQQLRGEVALDDVVDATCQAVTRTVQPSAAWLWLRDREGPASAPAGR